MENYIRYKRIVKDIAQPAKEIQEFFNELTAEGWEIIYYDERIKDMTTLTITVVVGKRQSNVL